ncbi:AAA family ATPase [Candidatus Woesearchaeota archaeon]|nr:AAA family ATPase [Candidatus Woesearchaeota archaeon]
MCGSGKSVIADELVRRGYSFFRFGQITLDIVKERGLEPTEANEKIIRESVRKEHGMGAYATLNIPKIDAFLKEGNVVGDGLYSWSEYKILKKKYGKQLVVIAVYAPPEMRYERLEKRKLAKDDKDLRNRPFTVEEARKRDFAEIENIEKGGPIAMADHTLINEGTVAELLVQFEKVMKKIGGE